MSTSRRAGLLDLLRDVRRSLHREDLALDSAGVTFYGGVAVVPVLLLAVAGASLLVGDARLHALAGEVSALLPDTLGARGYAERLVAAGIDLTPVQVLSCVLPATLYGEGLLRAFDRLTHEPGGRLLRGWRGRLLTLPVIAAAPVGLLALTAFGAWTREALTGRTGTSLLGVYVAFLALWVLVSLLLAATYRLLARRRVGSRALAWGAAATGSVQAGFLLGLVLFLSLDLPLGLPFGGFFGIGLLVASALWGFVLHVIVLVGYALTLRIDARGGHPTGPVLQDEPPSVEPVPTTLAPAPR